MRRRAKRKGAAIAIGCLAALSLLAGASPASAVTLGHLAPGATNNCDANVDLLQQAVTAGNSYVVPSTGGVTTWTLTSWSTRADDSGTSMSMKVFRKIGEPARYMVIGHEGPHALVPGLNTFSAGLQVKSGDVLGLHTVTEDSPCAFTVPGETVFAREGNLADGASGDFVTAPNALVNVSAEITPTSDFTLGKLKRKSNGTAVLTVNVPNPGNLTVAGKGVKGSSAGAVAAKQVGGGAAKLVIRAKGKKRAKLADTGKVTVKPKIRFTPTGGAANVESRKVKLRRK